MRWKKAYLKCSCQCCLTIYRYIYYLQLYVYLPSNYYPCNTIFRSRKAKIAKNISKNKSLLLTYLLLSLHYYFDKQKSENLFKNDIKKSHLSLGPSQLQLLPLRHNLLVNQRFSIIYILPTQLLPSSFDFYHWRHKNRSKYELETTRLQLLLLRQDFDKRKSKNKFMLHILSSKTSICNQPDLRYTFHIFGRKIGIYNYHTANTYLTLYFGWENKYLQSTRP